MRITLILLCVSIFSCSPVPESIETKFKTDERGSYRGADVGVKWEL